MPRIRKRARALGRARYERNRDEVLLGRAVDADAKESDALGKLARYERGLEKSLFRTLDELRQRQDRRRNRPSPPILDTVRSTQAIQNDFRSTHSRGAPEAHKCPASYCSEN